MKMTEQELAKQVDELSHKVGEVLHGVKVNIVLLVLCNLLSQSIQKHMPSCEFLTILGHFIKGFWQGSIFDPENN